MKIEDLMSLNVDIKLYKGKLRNTCLFILTVETKSLENQIWTRILQFGHSDHQKHVKQFAQDLAVEIEDQYKKKLMFRDGVKEEDLMDKDYEKLKKIYAGEL